MEIEKDIQAILDFSHQFAEYMLINEKEYYPFAAKIDNFGELITLAYKDLESDYPTSTKVINEMKSRLENEYANDKIKAYGLTYDVRIQIDDFGDKSDAICVEITHRDFDKIPKFYFTYFWNEREELFFGKTFRGKQ